MTDHHTQAVLSAAILMLCLGAEVAVLFLGLPHGVPEVVAGRVLGTLDACAIMVLSYHYGSSAGSRSKDRLFAESTTLSKLEH